MLYNLKNSYYMCKSRLNHILILFLNFRPSEPGYSYRLYSYITKECTSIVETLKYTEAQIWFERLSPNIYPESNLTKISTSSNSSKAFSNYIWRWLKVVKASIVPLYKSIHLGKNSRNSYFSVPTLWMNPIFIYWNSQCI